MRSLALLACVGLAGCAATQASAPAKPYVVKSQREECGGLNPASVRGGGNGVTLVYTCADGLPMYAFGWNEYDALEHGIRPTR